ncbi:AF4/FMR2 family member 1 isoform X1 [Ascaphus truei]|uniref:AF4/FMR2 family member 1 isoform X1 n=1 Tax=Ascaphus truei TaxID=8439 RepID=UPI003F599822
MRRPKGTGIITPIPERLGRREKPPDGHWTPCIINFAMAAQSSLYNEERNLLRIRERERRNQEALQERESSHDHAHLFAEPFKTSKGDELSSRIQSMLGNYEEVKELIGAKSHQNLIGVPNSAVPATSQGKPDKQSDVSRHSFRSGTPRPAGPPISSSDVPSGYRHRPRTDTELTAGRLLKSHKPARGRPQDHISRERYSGTMPLNKNVRQPQENCSAEKLFSSPSSISALSPLLSALSPPVEPLSPLHSSHHVDSKSRGSKSHEKTYGHTTKSSPAQGDNGNRDGPSTTNLGSSAQTFPPPLPSKTSAMPQKPTAYVRPMDGQDQAPSESPDLKPLPEDYHGESYGSHVDLKASAKEKLSKLEMPSEPFETFSNEAHCVEEILKEMTHSWPPPLTAIHTPSTAEPSKFPFPTKDSQHVPSVKVNQKQYDKSSKLLPSPQQGTSMLENDLQLSDSDNSDEEEVCEKPPSSSAPPSVQPSQTDSVASAHSSSVVSESSDSDSSSDSESEGSSSGSERNQPPRAPTPEPDPPLANKWQLDNWLPKASQPAAATENHNVVDHEQQSHQESKEDGSSCCSPHESPKTKEPHIKKAPRTFQEEIRNKAACSKSPVVSETVTPRQTVGIKQPRKSVKALVQEEPKGGLKVETEPVPYRPREGGLRVETEPTPHRRRQAGLKVETEPTPYRPREGGLKVETEPTPYRPREEGLKVETEPAPYRPREGGLKVETEPAPYRPREGGLKVETEPAPYRPREGGLKVETEPAPYRPREGGLKLETEPAPYRPREGGLKLETEPAPYRPREGGLKVETEPAPYRPREGGLKLETEPAPYRPREGGLKLETEPAPYRPREQPSKEKPTVKTKGRTKASNSKEPKSSTAQPTEKKKHRSSHHGANKTCSDTQSGKSHLAEPHPKCPHSPQVKSQSKANHRTNITHPAVVVCEDLHREKVLIPIGDNRLLPLRDIHRTRALVVKIELSLLSRVPWTSGKISQPKSKKGSSQQLHCKRKEEPEKKQTQNHSIEHKKRKVEKADKNGTHKKMKLEKEEKLSSNHKESSSLKVPKKSSENLHKEHRQPKTMSPAPHAHTKPEKLAQKRRPSGSSTCSQQSTASSNKSSHKEPSSSKHRKVEEKHTEHLKSNKGSTENNTNPFPVPSLPNGNAKPTRPQLKFEEKLYTPEHYMKEAKKLKHKADVMSDRIGKAFNYLDAAMFFIECGLAMEADLQAPKSAYTMFADTVDLIKFIMKLKNFPDSSAPANEKALAVICMRCQSVLYMAMFRYKKDTAIKYSRTLGEHFKSSSRAAQAPSPCVSRSTGTPSPLSPMPSPASSGGSQPGSSASNGGGQCSSVTIPQMIHHIASSYVNITSYFLYAYDIWEQADLLAKKNKAFFTDLSTMICPLALNSTMTELVHYTRQGLQWLRLESNMP